MTARDTDRTEHARRHGVAVVRYDRAGKWWIEHDMDGHRRQVKLDEAVDVAAELSLAGGHIFWGRPGGLMFDARLRNRFPATEGDDG